MWSRRTPIIPWTYKEKNQILENSCDYSCWTWYTRSWQISQCLEKEKRIFYIDNILGNDNNNGLSAETPWKTLNKVNNTILNPGDKILLKRGQTFNNETLIINHSGTEENPITYWAYDEWENPIINPSTIVSGFTIHEGNIYKANIGTWLSIWQIILENFGRIDIAHEPNNLYLFPSSNATWEDYIIDNWEYTYEQLINADIHVRPEPWLLEVKKIINYDTWTNKITLNSSVGTERYMTIGDWYFLSNRLWMLDKPGERYYNSSSWYCKNFTQKLLNRIKQRY